ncbi:SPOR domain-containing protein [candidate division KSB1 bacterium]|nr:SPOR domain-containing protein [candidate division KSB1 bacterium]
MEPENRRIAWIGGLLVLLLAGLLGWILLSRKQADEPIAVSTPTPDTTFTTPITEPPADLPPQESPKPQIVVEDGKYTVQVSSWQTRRRAEEDAERYAAKGFNAYIQEAYIPSKGGTWYRVRVGRYATQDDAEQMASQLAGLLEAGFWVDRYRQGNQ